MMTETVKICLRGQPVAYRATIVLALSFCWFLNHAER